jgi:hypothetical protein
MAPTREIIKKLLNFIDADDLIKLTSDLVRINSVWDPAGKGSGGLCGPVGKKTGLRGATG